MFCIIFRILISFFLIFTACLIADQEEFFTQLNYQSTTSVSERTVFDSCGNMEVPIVQEWKNCPQCINNKMNELSHEEIKQLRVHMLKQQLLEKLQLEEPPCIKLSKPSMQALRAAFPGFQNGSFSQDPDQDDENVSEKLNSMIIFPSDKVTCYRPKETYCSRYEFQLRDVDFSSLAYLEFWFFKMRETLETPLLLSVFNVPELNEPLISVQEKDENEGAWVKFILPSRNFSSILNNFTMLGVEAYGSSIAESGEEKPFLVIRLRTKTKSNRSRRSADCTEHSTTCCRKPFKLSFEDIGWTDWVVEPREYLAYYCQGECLHDLSVVRYGYGHGLFNFRRRNRTAAAALGVKLCCAPSKMSPLSMIYMTDNVTVIVKHMDNMVVDSCECI